jgi:hypothetical protein
MPAAYASPNSSASATETAYQVIVSEFLDPPTSSEANERNFHPGRAPFELVTVSSAAPPGYQSTYPGRGRAPAEIYDGFSRTICVIEAPNSVPWTKPADVLYDPTAPLPQLFRDGEDHFDMVAFDSSVRSVSRDVPESTLRAAISHRGGEEEDLP